VAPTDRSQAGKGEPDLRFQNLKVSARATALALTIGVVGVLVTALPASASTITSFTPTCGVAGTVVTINGAGFTGMSDVLFNGTSSSGEVFVSDAQVTATVPAGATAGPITVETPAADSASTANFIPAASGVPTITSFLPTTGSVGTSVVITGTNFGCTSSVMFNTTAATTYVVNSATQITATVPTGATTGPLKVTTPGGTATSATNFTVVAGPTITSFTPTSGAVGTSVTITGTNLTGVTAVKFNGVTATFTTSTATSVTATVPAGATTGKITVTTPGGTATSATDFTVTTVTKHARSVNLNLKKHLTATGTVSVGDGFNACRSNVTVKVQRLKNGVWKTVGTDQTTGNGKYKEVLKDKTGKYRAIAKKKVLNGGDDVCKADTSPTRKHHH
jgi:IPT/TIG domain-containing protein